jgi:hypothetical protein
MAARIPVWTMHDERRRLRTKNLALGAVLVALVVLFYILGIVRFGTGS